MNESLFLEAPYGNLVGKWVTYWGSETAWRGQDFLIIAQGENSNTNRIAFYADGQVQWRTLGASFSEPFDKNATQAVSTAVDDFLNPHESTKVVVRNELKRLEDRIAELKATLKVLDSL
jgi:hypothetical protein